MDKGTLALLIPVLGILCGVLGIIGGAFVRPWIKLKHAELEARRQGGMTDAATQRIEERLQVLERIVTDRRMDLAGEIEALRIPAATTQEKVQ